MLGAGGSQQSQGHALMSALGSLLNFIALQYTAAVVCTNHMVASGTSNPCPALGESWKVQPHTQLQLLRPAVGDGMLFFQLLLQVHAISKSHFSHSEPC